MFMGLACSYAAMAQARVVSGTVKDPDGVALPGVSVVVKNTTTGANADVEGKFSIPVPNIMRCLCSLLSVTHLRRLP